MTIAINAAASAKAKATIIAVNILDAAEGFRPREFILAKALAAKTAQGPRIHAININVRARLRSMASLFLNDSRHMVFLHLHHASCNGK